MMYYRAYVNGHIISRAIKLSVVCKRKRKHITCQYMHTAATV
jgi:hypothetical protein